MPSNYTFSEYSIHWPDEFDREASRLQGLLHNKLIAIHHIGSTSVPGLAAKPIIDVLPLVRDIQKIDECTVQFEKAGYRAWGEYGIPGRRFFTKDQNNTRTHNVHILQNENPEIARHIAFCAYLRQHTSVRDEYATLKRKIYKLHPEDITAYNNAKDTWIKRVEQLAIQWLNEEPEE